MAASAGAEAVSGLVAKPAVKRLSGGKPSRREALFAAMAVGVGAAGLVYRLLRSGDE